MSININTQHPEEASLSWHQQKESDRYENSVWCQKWTVYSPVVKVKAIFGETVTGNGYCRQLSPECYRLSEPRPKHRTEKKDQEHIKWMKSQKDYCRWSLQTDSNKLLCTWRCLCSGHCRRCTQVAAKNRNSRWSYPWVNISCDHW